MKCAINTLPFDRGGGITYLKNVLPRLEDTDDQYYIIVPSGRNELENHSNMEYIEVNFPVSNVISRLIYEQLILPFVVFFYDVDVLYSPTGITTLLSPCPTVNAVRNPNPFQQQLERSRRKKLRHQAHRFLIRLSIRQSDTTIFVSQYTSDKVRDYFAVPVEKSQIIHHGITISQFRNPVKNKRFYDRVCELQPFLLCVSSIYEHKNYEVLIKGYSELTESLRNEYSLVIAGGYTDQEYYDSIHSLVRSEGLEENIIFLGKVNYENIPLLYSLAELTVLPSKLETFGHPLVESMAAGTPLVAANSACIPEITGDAALLFDPDDPDDLANCIQRVLTDPTCREELIKSGEKRVESFSWDRTTEKTHSVLRSAVGGY